MKKFLLSVILGFSLLIPSISQASHVAGAELRYEHLSGNRYRFHLLLYRDCAGININYQYTITGIPNCGGGITNILVNADSSNTIGQICAGYTDQCILPTSQYMGFEVYYYHGDTILPSQCDDWSFSFYICNRNSAITNVVDPDSNCMYIETELNNLDVPDNNSPILTALPIFNLCNQVQYLHLFAQDPDGDSLAFEMYTPHSDGYYDLQYINGLSAYQPVTYALPQDSTRFNPLTGDIRFVADGAQITVVGVRVKEYRNGIFIGSEERDIEVLFGNCSSHPPIATGINNTLNFSAHVCADSLFSFFINTFDADTDSIRISWQNAIPGSTIILTGANNQTVNFAWHPMQGDISNSPYTFTLSVTDSICPYVYSNSYQYNIFVDSCFAVSVIDKPEQAVSFNATYSASDEKIIYSLESVEVINGSLSLLDLQGRILWTEKINATKFIIGKIPASNLSMGIYLLRMSSGNGGVKTIKVVTE